MTSYVMCSKKKLGINKSDIECLKKSIEDRKLEYFKSELLKILDKKEKEESGEEVSKAFIVQDLYKSMTDPLYMAKGGKVGVVGEIRTWNGKKYKKMPNKKWVRVYDKETRGAKMAIAALRRKIDACTDSQELLNLVLQNKERFCDELGRPLPIVQELSKYISEKNDKIESSVKKTNKKNDSQKNNEKIEIDSKDFPEQFNKGKWKKQTKTLMDFMNSTDGDSTVKSLYKKLGTVINDLPFKIAKPKDFSNGSFTLWCGRKTMKPVEQTLHLLEISDETEDIKRDTCMKALHEIMHMIDFSCRNYKDSPDYLSNSNEEIKNAINNAKISDDEINELEGHFKDFRAQERKIIESLNEKARKIKELGKRYENNEITIYEEYGKKYREIQSQWESERKKIAELRAKNVEISQYADILDALSGGDLHDDKGFCGHGRTYYRKESNKANEIVANYAALLASGSEYANRLKKNYPELAESVYNLYKGMLER